MRIINKTKNTVLAQNTLIAKELFKRIQGLLGRKDFPQGEALVIQPCNSIHTFFMHFPIDVLFIDKSNKIIWLKAHLKPWRLSPICGQAKLVIELPSGTLSESQTVKGDEISLV